MVKRGKTTSAKPAKRGLASLSGERQDEKEYIDNSPPRSGIAPPGFKPRVPPRPERPRVGGLALQDPADLRSERYGMRLHPDLRFEMTRLARQRGWKLAQWIEKALIEAVNAQCGFEKLDMIGRHLPSEPDEED